MLAKALLSCSISNSNVILKEYIKTETNPSYLWAMDDKQYSYTYNDDFTGSDGDPVNQGTWNSYTTNAINTINSIYNNQYNCAGTKDGSSDGGVTSQSLYLLRGDFDVQVECGFLAGNTSTNRLLEFYVGGYLISYYYAGEYRVGSNLAGSWNYTSVASGQYELRCTRVGSLVSVYYRLFGSTTWILSSSSNRAEDVIKVILHLTIRNSGHANGYFDNLIVNSGEVVWPAIEEIVDNYGELINEPIAQQPPLTAYSLPTDKSFLINGSTQAIDTNLTVSSQASRTVLMTFEMTAFPEPQLLFSDGDYEGLTKRLHLGINTDYWTYIISDGVESFDESNVHLHNLIVGEKYIVAYVIDDHDVTIYVNGIASASFTIPANIDPAVGVGDLMIGKDGSADLFYGNFYVDLFVVYDEALAQNTIQAISNIFKTGSV